MQSQRRQDERPLPEWPPVCAIRSNHLKIGENYDHETLSNKAWIIRQEI